nr:MAG TPA: hypothetical protein [Caudoviricetes sp.]
MLEYKLQQADVKHALANTCCRLCCADSFSFSPALRGGAF